MHAQGVGEGGRKIVHSSVECMRLMLVYVKNTCGDISLNVEWKKIDWGKVEVSSHHNL